MTSVELRTGVYYILGQRLKNIRENIGIINELNEPHARMFIKMFAVYINLIFYVLRA